MDRSHQQWLPPPRFQPAPQPGLPAPPPPRRTGIKRFTGPLFFGLLAR